ncbi:pectinesterase family protein [Actinoplanes couchii]|uniref:Pectinesterase n=1 Tax=Actinoplanes couchii TaxID=403638 RepID=A0ABQ3XHV3_9ACTN|nr:pectinesterase family protein [Actinoplanes couchii]MDR6317698.1 pectinesterase [Actinoplanes couchii]GID58083.1 hypothetical protein Aco03nite_064870 [Actinoplanes couchii]
MAVPLPHVVALFVGIPAALAAVAPAANGVYTIASGASGKCLDVGGASTANGGLLVQVACNTAAGDQQFTAVAQNGGFGLVNTTSAKCVDVPYSTTDQGTQLWQWTCGASANQTWTFTASTAAPGKYLIRSAANGLCVSDKDGSTAGNNPIVQETCSDIARMQWSFNQVSGGGTTTATVAADGTGTYRTVQAAVDAVPAGNTTRRIITIKAGTYREIVTVPANKPYITFEGLGTDYSKTTIINNRDAGHYGLQGSGTVQVYGHDFAATNLTITNDYDENTYETGDQALALYLDSDRSRFSSVRLLGDQDTFLVDNNARTYFTGSYIEGTTDFIFGAGVAVFANSTIHEKRSTGGTMTAASTPDTKTYGFLFYKCTITGTGSNNTTLGRPWRQGAQVLFRESSLGNTVRTAQPWTDMSTNTWQNARFTEYKNTGSGATVNGNRLQLTDAQAANHTPQKYLAGTDGWNPL